MLRTCKELYATFNSLKLGLWNTNLSRLYIIYIMETLQKRISYAFLQKLSDNVVNHCHNISECQQN